MSKYRNQKVNIDGYNFDSKAESKRYQELKLMQDVGLIKDLQLQPKFELIPTFKKNGKTYRKTVYIADFSYFSITDNKTIVEDFKGFKTEIYRLKKKLFEYNYPELEIKEVTKNDTRAKNNPVPRKKRKHNTNASFF